jgi:hypothetical protein
MRQRTETKNSPRVTTKTTGQLEKGLVAYTIMASAAGIGILAAAPSAEAKIVYTPVNVSVSEALPHSSTSTMTGSLILRLASYSGNIRPFSRSFLESRIMDSVLPRRVRQPVSSAWPLARARTLRPGAWVSTWQPSSSMGQYLGFNGP